LSGSDQTKAAAQELLSRHQARASVEQYIAYLELGILPALHHRLILRELEAVERGDASRQMIRQRRRRMQPQDIAGPDITPSLTLPWCNGFWPLPVYPVGPENSFRPTTPIRISTKQHTRVGFGILDGD